METTPQPPQPLTRIRIHHLLHPARFSMSHHPLLRFLFCFAFYALFLPCTICDVDPSYQFCQQNAQCGDTQIHFPFGIKGDRYACGDPNFGLFCLYDRLPLLPIGTNNYSILHASKVGDFNNDRRITIVHTNSWAESVCNPLAYSIDSWNSSYFRIDDQYRNRTFLTDCLRLKISSSIVKLNCSDWYYDQSDVSQDPETFGCEKLAQVPIPKDHDHPTTLGNLDFLQAGFEVIWSYYDENRNRTCDECLSSGGICGYNISNGDFLCHCKDGQRSNKCLNDNDGRVADRSNKNKTIPAIGGSVAGVAVISVAILLLVFYLRRKTPSNRRLVSDISPDQSTDMEAALPGRKAANLPSFGNLPVFSYEELQEATDGFAEKNELGDGGFGSVYLGRLWDGRAVAVKRLYQDNSRRLQQFMNEVELFSSLHHRNLVRLFGCSSPHSPELLLVYEYVPNGTLADHLHGELKGKGLFWNTRLNIAIETAQALAFLHGIEPPIFHRDVKSSNILLDENFTVKLADFGLSRLVPLDATHVTTAPQGTPGYLDPDYHQCYQLTEKSDVYSFGVVLLEIISAKLAVDITRNRREISLANMAITKLQTGALHELVDPNLEIESNHLVKVMVSGVAELALGCLAAEKDDRPHMKEVVAQLEQIKQMGYIACPDRQPSTDHRSQGSPERQ